MSFMNCEETRQTLSLYVDDCVSLPARVAIDEHLDRCPVCRAEVAELRLLTRRLNMMTRPAAPAGLAESITDLLTIEAAARLAPKPSWGRRVARFVEPRLMPYSVGSFASVILFFLMFTALRPHFVALREAALNNGGLYNDDAYVVRSVRAIPGYDLYEPVNSQISAAAADLPSLNPNGALAAFTRTYSPQHASYDHDADADADDMLVKVTIFSNGAASLSAVEKVPRDLRKLDDFESALRRDAPFVRAVYDRRPDTMSVLFALGGPRVEVYGQNF
jgi:hypothetical protein